MGRPPARASTTVTAANLRRLGVERLAALLAEEARHDRALRGRVALALAEDAGGEDLAIEIERRVNALPRGPAVESASAIRDLAREVAALAGIVENAIAPTDHRLAVALLRRIAETEGDIAARAGGHHRVTEALTDSTRALVRLWGAMPDRDASETVAFMLERLLADDVNVEVELETFDPLLGREGLEALRAALRARLDALPEEHLRAPWRMAFGPAYHAKVAAMRLRQPLLRIADSLGDVDDYIAVATRDHHDHVDSVAIAERLLATGRAEEALGWLDDARYNARAPRAIDARLRILDALGRRDEAQAARWAWFERTLSPDALRAYLKRLPDFEDDPVERRAIAYVVASRHAGVALDFLLAWPNLEAAARLVRERLADLDAHDVDRLLAAAAALRDTHPAECEALLRKVVTRVVRDGVIRHYDAVIAALADLAALDGTLGGVEGREAHAAFVERLRGASHRKHGLWGRYDAAARG
ncbi:MAG: hypothetical protein IPK81_08860 [Rhodospirillales bacterium]|nr:MAG: hypothetical protein IPK81_08860 [Rhodospirillales bacterium]